MKVLCSTVDNAICGWCLRSRRGWCVTSTSTWLRGPSGSGALIFNSGLRQFFCFLPQAEDRVAEFEHVVAFFPKIRIGWYFHCAIPMYGSGSFLGLLSVFTSMEVERVEAPSTSHSKYIFVSLKILFYWAEAEVLAKLVLLFLPLPVWNVEPLAQPSCGGCGTCLLSCCGFCWCLPSLDG